MWGPKTVIGVFALAGGLIGADIAFWPWEEPISLKISVLTGVLTGLFIGLFIAWVVREMEMPG